MGWILIIIWRMALSLIIIIMVISTSCILTPLTRIVITITINTIIRCWTSRTSALRTSWPSLTPWTSTSWTSTSWTSTSWTSTSLTSTSWTSTLESSLTSTMESSLAFVTFTLLTLITLN